MQLNDIFFSSKMYWINSIFTILTDNLEELDKRVKIFFSDCKRYSNELPPSADSEYQEIRKEYYKALEDADEKVDANFMLLL